MRPTKREKPITYIQLQVEAMSFFSSYILFFLQVFFNSEFMSDVDGPQKLQRELESLELALGVLDLDVLRISVLGAGSRRERSGSRLERAFRVGEGGLCESSDACGTWTALVLSATGLLGKLAIETPPGALTTKLQVSRSRRTTKRKKKLSRTCTLYSQATVAHTQSSSPCRTSTPRWVSSLASL